MPSSAIHSSFVTHWSPPPDSKSTSMTTTYASTASGPASTAERARRRGSSAATRPHASGRNSTMDRWMVTSC